MRLFILLLLAGAAVTVGADEFVLIRGDAIGVSSFNSASNWNNQLAPEAGHTYRTGSYQLRTPEGTAAHVFAGDRLTVSAGGNILWKSQGNITVDDLVLAGGSIGHGQDHATARLFGNISVTAASSFTANENNPRTFMIYSTISGTANLTIAMNQTSSLKQTSFLADNSGYTGKLTLRGRGKFGAVAEEGLGGNPAAFSSDQVAFEGATFIATNTFMIDDANRGFTLNNTLNAGSHIYPGGFFEVTGANTLTVGCPITGAGPLGKRGSGTLSLSGANTYAGLTTVEAGTLRLATGASHGLSSLVVSGSTARVIGEGVLSNVTLAAGGRLAAEKGGWDIRRLDVLNTTNVTFEVDLSEANPDVTLIRVAGDVSKVPMQVFQFVVNTNNAMETPYRVLSASNLNVFASYDFCVTPPWIGELSVAPDAGGGQVLLFTPTPQEKIVFLIASDPINTSAFLLGERWSDGLSPTNEPTGVKTYVCRTQGPRTPHTQSMTFGGKRLVMDGQNLTLKGVSAVPTITDLTMMNDASCSTAEPVRQYLAGNIRLHPVQDAGRTYAMRVTGNNSGRDLHLYATLSGYGDLFLFNQGNPAYFNNVSTFYADNPDFLGRIHVEGHTNFWLRIGDEVKLGGNPPFFRADQLRFNGGGISVTNDVTLDDANRGVTLLATGGTSGTDVNAGGFPSGTDPSILRYEGGATLRAEGQSTLTVACPVTGAGRLVKDGTGTLVLGGANTYTGITDVVAGALRPASATALGAGPVRVRGAGRLLFRHPLAEMPSGVELGGPLAFDEGAAVQVGLAEGQPLAGNFTVPLFLLAAGQSVEPSAVPVVSLVDNFHPMVTVETVGEGESARMLVSVRMQFSGTVMMLR